MEPAWNPNQQQRRSPLGLPCGSVRAMLSVCIMSVVLSEMVNGHELEVFWSEVLMISLAHYFTSRKFIDLPYPVLERLAAEGFISKEIRPLGLPRWFIQLSIVGAFAGVAYYLYEEKRLLVPHVLSVLGMVAFYLVGVCVRVLTLAYRGWEANGKTVSWWDDLKAIVVLGVMIVTAWMYLVKGPAAVPTHFRSVGVGLVLFYFGSR